MKILYTLVLISASLLIGGSLNENQYDNNSLTTIESKSEVEVKEFFQFFMKSIEEYQYLQMSKNYQTSDDNWIVKSDLALEEAPENNILIYKNYYPILSCDTISYFDRGINQDNIKASIISFKDQNSSNFYFTQTNDNWALQKTEVSSIKSLQDSTFLKFLNSFISDSKFQAEHIATPLLSCSLDYHGDMDVISNKMTKERWLSTYGDNLDLEQLITFNIEEESDIRAIKLRGVANGCSIKFTFKRSDNVWKLIKVEDYSM